jgi:mono/diheme cytochrome c family protein
MTTRLCAASMLTLLCLAGSGAPLAYAQSNQTIPGNPINGRRIFVEGRCVRCHAIWGNGGTLGPDFASVGGGRSLQQLAGMFWNHTPRMIETVREPSCSTSPATPHSAGDGLPRSAASSATQ